MLKLCFLIKIKLLVFTFYMDVFLLILRVKPNSRALLELNTKFRNFRLISVKSIQKPSQKYYKWMKNVNFKSFEVNMSCTGRETVMHFVDELFPKLITALIFTCK